MAVRGALLAFILLAGPLAGCIGSDEPEAVQEQSLLDPVEHVIDMASSVAMPQDVSAAEPNIAVMDDGTIFVTAPIGLQEKPNMVEGSAWLWRSTDGGQTWETLRSPHVAGQDLLPLGPFCSCDADVTVSPDGVVYFSDWWDGNYLVEVSEDGGDSWRPSPMTTIDAAVLVNVDRQWLVAGEDGFVGLFYASNERLDPQDRAGFGAPAIRAVFSENAGLTWSPPVNVVVAEPGHFNQISKPTLLPDGTIAMAYGHMTPDGDDLWTNPAVVEVALSADGGVTWDHVVVADAPGGFDNLWAVQTASDDVGNLYVAWAARDGENVVQYVAESPDAGATWSEPIAVRSEGINFLPWIDATGDGRVAVGWYGSDVTGDPLEAPDGTEWFAYVAERPDASSNFTVTRASEDPVKVGEMCAIGASCPSDRELLDYVGVAYGGPDDVLHYVYARSSTAGGVDIGAQVHFTFSLSAPTPQDLFQGADA